MDCDACYKAIVSAPCAVPFISFSVGLVPGAVYNLWVVQGDHAWMDSTIIGAGGEVFLSTSNYPVGLFNQYANYFKVYLTTDVLGLNRVDLTINAEIYTCIVFKVN
jgi:hypothetical protein